MHERTNIRLSRADCSTLEAAVADRNSPQKHVWRARIVLLTADGHCFYGRRPGRRDRPRNLDLGCVYEISEVPLCVKGIS
jgi:hypothetical protein